eukprot:GFYU01001816.1.p1 GENE.GFYU01001816.1~~GFYU01001816.1.p1  ORF type:complete len:173 (-),score=65.07 GFYU01001816.1:323-841(-)
MSDQVETAPAPIKPPTPQQTGSPAIISPKDGKVVVVRTPPKPGSAEPVPIFKKEKVRAKRVEFTAVTNPLNTSIIMPTSDTPLHVPEGGPECREFYSVNEYKDFLNRHIRSVKEPNEKFYRPAITSHNYGWNNKDFEPCCWQFPLSRSTITKFQEELVSLKQRGGGDSFLRP